mmetsp:Transcript_25536/g.82289  ORF Transcript_25536/g.82289 Transcript_25536/m.82289 type:complete len:178 (-) Transcript_25536:15-548(-)
MKLEQVSKRASERRFFCDAEGWITSAVQKAVLAAGFSAAVVNPWMRFLRYKLAGEPLKPHDDKQWLPGHKAQVDVPFLTDPRLLCEENYAELSARVGAVEKTSHSFLLYLTDCEIGGETQLLEHMVPRVEDNPSVVSAVCAPRRGRLLMFPHACIHAGAPVPALPKLVLRGDVLCIP